MASSLKKFLKIVLTDNDILLMARKKGNRGGICHAIHQNAKAYKKYIKHYHKNKESSYLNYCDEYNLYG